MDFKNWIEAKFNQWSRGRKSETQFALYLGVSQATFNAWKNGTRGAPKSIKIIRSLAEKLGPETYDVLGVPRPAGEINVRDQLVSFGLPEDFVDDLLEVRDEYTRELENKGIAFDSPEARRIVSKALARLKIKVVEVSDDEP